MDVEKTIAFLQEHQANFESHMGLLAQHQSEASMRHEKEMAEFRSGMADLRNELRRAINAGIEEQRRERKRRHELDERVSQSLKELADAQKRTEEILQRLLDRQ